MTVSIRIGTCVILLLAIWYLCFVALAFTAGGKDFYGALAEVFFIEDAAVPVMNLGIPILLAGTLATVLMFLNSDSSVTTKSALPASVPSWMHRMYHKFRAGSGDLDCRRFTIYCVCWPLAILLIADIARHLYGETLSLDDQLMEVGNAFGFVALVAMSYFLIPVARQSPILKFFQINPVAAVTVHIWSGRIVIIGVAIHGLFHVYRWKALAGESIIKMIVPPAPCWRPTYDTDFSPECVDEDTDCECYDILRNLTGIVALILLTVIGITSMNYVRRTNYRLFYLTHVMAGPLTLVMVIIHWRKSMAYIAPSILYYIATSFPVMTENQTCLKQDGGIKLTRVERIQSSHAGRPRQCMSLTIKATPAAVSTFRSGQYVKLTAPQVSSISHPFTISRIPGCEDEMRIIFRVMGRFTHKLSHQLTNPVNGALPRIMIDGYHGAQNRRDQVLKHDVAVMVAGGIGITPYLSLIEDTYDTLSSTDASVTKEVVLHWVCREQELIDYILKEHFEPLMAKADADGFNIRIIVHKTMSTSSYNDEATEDVEAPKQAQAVQSHGGAFCPTLYSAGSSCSTIHILIATLTFITISWVGLWSVLALYHHNHAKHEILYRLISPAFVLVLGLVVSWLAKCIFPIQGRCEAMSLRLHDGAVFTRLRANSSTMEDVLGHHDDLLQEVQQQSNSISNTVSYEEHEGPRPTVHALLKQLDTARCPGLFMCGPNSLIEELKDAAAERCSIRRCQCISDEPNIAIYEELFEM